MQGHTSTYYGHLVILVLQDHLERTKGAGEAQGTDLGGACRVPPRSSTDLGLTHMEFLVVIVNDGILWAAGADEADALAE